MRLIIENLCCIESWECGLYPGSVTHIESDNSTGKSTAAAALAACLARNPDPLKRGVSRLGSYAMRTASGASAATLTGQDWEIVWRPGADFIVNGDPPHVPELAVLDPAQRGREQWLAALIGDPLTVETLADIITDILGKDARATATQYANDILRDEPHSWDRFQGTAQERRSNAKRSWREAVAGAGEAATYGSKVAANWRPRGWTPELENETKDTLERVKTAAKERLSEAHGVLAELRNKDTDYRKAKRAVADHKAEIAKVKQGIADLESMDRAPDAVLLRGYQDDQAAHERALSKLDSQLERIDFRRSEQTEKGKTLARRVGILEDEIAEAERNAKSMRAGHDREVTQLRSTIGDRKAALNRMESSTANEGLCKTCPYAKDTSGERAKIRGEIKHLQARLDALEADGPPKGEDTTEKQERLERKRSELAASRKAYRAIADERKATEAARRIAQSEATDTDKRIAEYRRKHRKAGERDKHLGQYQGRLRTLQERTPELPEPPPVDAVETAQREADVAQGNVREAERRQKLVKAVAAAAAAHAQAEIWNALERLVSPQAHGLRAKRTADAITETNEWLRHCAPWLDITVSKQLSLRVNGALLADASESEAWMAKAALRMTVGARHRVPAIVIDGVDILSATYRPKALTTIRELAEYTGIAVLLTETVAGEDAFGSAQ